MNIYQENILDHYQHPRHAGALKKHTYSTDAINANCGDELHVEILVEKNTVKDVAISGVGCVLSKAGADILAEHIIGKKVSVIKKLTKDDMQRLLGIPLSPTRLKCALLGLEGINKAL